MTTATSAIESPTRAASWNRWSVRSATDTAPNTRPTKLITRWYRADAPAQPLPGVTSLIATTDAPRERHEEHRRPTSASDKAEVRHQRRGLIPRQQDRRHAPGHRAQQYCVLGSAVATRSRTRRQAEPRHAPPSTR